MGPGLILAAATLALVAAGFWLGRRLRSWDHATPQSGSRHLSVIIPARNEEHNLPRLLKSLAEQSIRPCEIIVVDDGSTDRTAEVAREHGARVLVPAALPEGWRGKTWACHQGAQAAQGDLLLFLDADTWFESEGLARALAAYPGGAFSLAPFHAVQRPYEELSLFFNLVMTLGAASEALFGQMLLVDRESYRRVGGHARVKGRILENFSLAETFREAGIRVTSAVGRGILAFRMYPGGFRELVQGWSKGFASGASQTRGATLAWIIAWITGLTTAALACVLSAGQPLWLAIYACCAGQVAWMGRQVGAFRLVTALLYPLPLAFFFAVFALAAFRRGRTVSWKGRTIHAD